jgi:hypothetical protein
MYAADLHYDTHVFPQVCSATVQVYLACGYVPNCAVAL